MDAITNLLGDLTNTQVAVILVGVVVLYLMRGEGGLNVKGWLSALWAKVKPAAVVDVVAGPDANAVAAAYKTLAPYLTADTREVVRSEVAEYYLSAFDPED